MILGTIHFVFDVFFFLVQFVCPPYLFPLFQNSFIVSNSEMKINTSLVK